MNNISCHIIANIRGPIDKGSYSVNDAIVEVSYPSFVEGIPFSPELPNDSTLFIVKWSDENDVQSLKGKNFLRHFPIYKALDFINEILLAFKLVRIGHLDGDGLRPIGINDRILSYFWVDGMLIGNSLNVLGKRYGHKGMFSASDNPDDPNGTTPLAIPHINALTLPVARRYVRCFELLEHGFYSEAFIISFSIMDDQVQLMLHKLLEQKGVETEDDQKDFSRSIKENRLNFFLGPLLKVLHGKGLIDMWPKGIDALAWVNRTRNDIAHNGLKTDHTTAAKGIFVCLKILFLLNHERLIDAEIPVEIFRHAKRTAAWTKNAPNWVPDIIIAERMNFES